MFVTVPDSSVTVCDYLYPGEGAEDCVNNVREIFGWQLEEDSVEDDLEIVASPREARPQGPGGCGPGHLFWETVEGRTSKCHQNYGLLVMLTSMTFLADATQWLLEIRQLLIILSYRR